MKIIIFIVTLIVILESICIGLILYKIPSRIFDSFFNGEPVLLTYQMKNESGMQTFNYSIVPDGRGGTRFGTEKEWEDFVNKGGSL